MKPVISAEGLRKSYGALTVVKDLSLTINQGEIFAILGPNGAGKTLRASAPLIVGPFQS